MLCLECGEGRGGPGPLFHEELWGFPSRAQDPVGELEAGSDVF